MNASVGVLRHALARAKHLRSPHAGTAENPDRAARPANTALAGLVRQVFLSLPVRRCVFFVAPETDIAIGELCFGIARTLAEVSGDKVAVAIGSPPEPGAGQTETSNVSATGGRPAINRAGENVWSVPAELFQSELGKRGADEPDGLPFEFVVLGANVSDSIAPSFARSCEGAVLVVSANQTRREAALRAKEILASWNVELLGAVLENRTFPVPESIYRRL